MENRDKPTIAVDIDDCIAANALGFIAYSNEKYGTHLSIEDYQDHWGEVWKTEFAETERRASEYHASGHIASYTTIEGAFDVLTKLKERFRLAVLTTRRTSINELTKGWLEKNYPNIFDDIVFSGFFDNPSEESLKRTKGELAKELGASYIIDDQLKHVLAAAELGIKGILFGDYSWNRAEALPQNVSRVHNWKEVLEYFDTQ
jgi:uncharacterized HAD superfamily protein